VYCTTAPAVNPITVKYIFNFLNRFSTFFEVLNFMKICPMGAGLLGMPVRPARPRPTALLPPRSYGKPEAAAAADRLLMMGIRMPETC
jgi:hypothetical protein